MQAEPDLQRIVESAVTRMGKGGRWVPPSMDIDDVRQEAWVGVLSARELGVAEREELLRLTELHLGKVMSAELARPEIPMDTMLEDDDD